MPSELNIFHDLRKNAKIELSTAIFSHNVATDHRSTMKKKLAHLMSAFTHEKLRKNRKKKEKAEKSAFLGSPAVLVLQYQYCQQALTRYSLAKIKS